MNPELLEALEKDPAFICKFAYDGAKKIITTELDRVRNSPNPGMESRMIEKEVRLELIFNLGLFNLSLAQLGIDLDSAREMGLDNYTGGILQHVNPDITEYTSEIIRDLTQFIDCFFIHLVEMHVKTPDADLFIYGGTRCSVLFESFLAPSRFHQFKNEMLTEKIVAQLEMFSSQHLPYDFFNLDPSGGFCKDDRNFFHRDPGSALAWAFEQGIRMITLANIMHPKEYGKILLCLGFLSGFPVYEKTVEIEDTRQTVRQSKMMIESMLLRLQILRFELMISSNLFVDLEISGNIINIDLAFKNTKRDPQLDRQRILAEVYPRAISITSNYDARNFWGKFAQLTFESPLTRGQLQHFQIYVFWCSAPVGSEHASKILQPSRVDHKINRIKDAVHPEDFLMCVFFSSTACDAKGLIKTWLEFEKMGLKINELCVAEARAGNVPDYQKIKQEIFDEEIKKRDQLDVTRRIMERAPKCFAPGGVLHRRAVIIASLSFLDAFWETKELYSHIESHLIDQPVNSGILSRSGAITRTGGELCFVSHLRSLARSPTQCPVNYLVHYLGMYSCWRSNLKYNKVVLDFVASVASRKD